MVIKLFNYVSDGVHGSLTEDASGIPFVSSKDIKGGKINFSTKHVSKTEASRHKNRIKIDANNILITNSGTLGEIALIHSNCPEFTLQKSVAVCKVSEQFIPKYAYYWLITKKDYLINLGQGSAQKNILLKDLRKICCEELSKNVQQSIIFIIEQNEKLFLAHSNCIRIDSIEHVQMDMKSLIDIIEPLETLRDNIISIENKVNFLIKNLPRREEKFFLYQSAILIKNKPKGISQISAKTLPKRSPVAIGKEEKNTYKTNSFYVPKYTLLINTIRTYLEKFAIASEDLDANGTLAMIKVNDNWTSILCNLLNDDFWNKANLLSHGTKMPVLKNDDIMSKIDFYYCQIEIKDIEKIFTLITTLKLNLEILIKKAINVLIV